METSCVSSSYTFTTCRVGGSHIIIILCAYLNEDSKDVSVFLTSLFLPGGGGSGGDESGSCVRDRSLRLSLSPFSMSYEQINVSCYEFFCCRDSMFFSLSSDLGVSMSFEFYL